MKISICLAPTIIVAALLADCGGSQPTIGLSEAVPQTSGIGRAPTIMHRADSAGARYQVLYRFADGYDGAYPSAALIDVDGVFYGTTPNGGTDNRGTVFSITTNGTENVLYSFGNSPDGESPYASLLDVKGTLYGTTVSGGKYFNYSSNDYGGTVFSISTTGEEHVLHSFGNGSDGQEPFAGLIDVKGTLYGTTESGGKYGYGTVFSISTTGKERVMHSFSGSDGKGPSGNLIDVKGTLYSTTGLGGAYANGTVFSISTTGKERVLHSFGYGYDGSAPNAALLNVKGTLYGTTIYGGTYGGVSHQHLR